MGHLAPGCPGLAGGRGGGSLTFCSVAFLASFQVSLPGTLWVNSAHPLPSDTSKTVKTEVVLRRL